MFYSKESHFLDRLRQSTGYRYTLGSAMHVKAGAGAGAGAYAYQSI